MNPLRKIYNKIAHPTPSWEKMMALRCAMTAPGAEQRLARFIKKYGITHCGVKGGGDFLNCAAIRGQTRLVEMLLDAGMDINEKDGENTALDSAINSHNPKTIELLLDRGADINQRGTIGWRPLHSAAGFNKPEAFMLLLKRGADINIANDEGVTPLMHAATCGRKGMVAQLVRRGANLSATDKEGKTALHYAAHGQQAKIYRFLKKQGTPFESAKKGTGRAVKAMKPLKLKPLS